MRIAGILVACFVFLLATSRVMAEEFSLDDLADYQKTYMSEEIEVCSTSSVKTYMSYRLITSTTSAQYRYISGYMTVDLETGLLIDEDGFIGVALGSYFGEIGSRYYITLDTGVVLPVVKIESKADEHTHNGCSASSDGSVIEFVIDTDIASSYFGTATNGYILSGNFNNYDIFNGSIIAIEKVTNILIPQFELLDKTVKLEETGGVSFLRESETVCLLNSSKEVL